MIKAFPYFGGKSKVLNELFLLMPRDNKQFVDVFGGSMTVALNYPNMSAAITACDVNEDIINFFTVLREEKHQFLEALRYTPCAEQEYKAAWEGMESICRIERARCFFIRSMMGFYGLGSQRTKKGKSMSFSVGTKASKCNGRTEVVSRWDNGTERLLKVFAKMIRRRVQVVSCSYEQSIPKFDQAKTFFYVDPPYDPKSRSNGGYRHDFKEQDHIKLAALLYKIKGKVMVSGYRSALMMELYERKGWTTQKLKHQRYSSLTRRALLEEKQEWVWMNYEPLCQGVQQKLF